LKVLEFDVRGPRKSLNYMIEAGRISETDADVVQQQYTVFQDEVIKQSSQFATPLVHLHKKELE